MIDDDTTFERLVDAGENVCLTGPGGTGKSFRTRRLIAGNPSRFAVTASTGIAALNIGGLTLHRWSGMMLGPQNGESDEDYLDHLMADKRFSVRAGARRDARAARHELCEAGTRGRRRAVARTRGHAAGEENLRRYLYWTEPSICSTS